MVHRQKQQPMERWWSAPWVALVEFSIGFIFYEIFQMKYTIRWRWVSCRSYLDIFKYFEYFLIFQVVECTLGGAGRALDQVIAQSTATTSTQPTPLMHTMHQAPCTAHHAHFPLLTCTPHHHPNRPHSHHFHSSCSSHAMQWRASPP